MMLEAICNSNSKNKIIYELNENVNIQFNKKNITLNNINESYGIRFDKNYGRKEFKCKKFLVQIKNMMKNKELIQVSKALWMNWKLLLDYLKLNFTLVERVHIL